MTEPDWKVVQCRGGVADGFEYETLIEPPETIVLMHTPWRDGEWVRVLPETPREPEIMIAEYRRAVWEEGRPTDRVFIPVDGELVAA